MNNVKWLVNKYSHSHGAFGYEKVLHLLRTFFHRISEFTQSGSTPNRGRSESLRVGEDVIGAMTFECHSVNVLPHGCCVFFGVKDTLLATSYRYISPLEINVCIRPYVGIMGSE